MINSHAHSTMVRLNNGKACYLESWSDNACLITLVYEGRSFWTNIGNIREFWQCGVDISPIVWYNRSIRSKQQKQKRDYYETSIINRSLQNSHLKTWSWYGIVNHCDLSQKCQAWRNADLDGATEKFKSFSEFDQAGLTYPICTNDHRRDRTDHPFRCSDKLPEQIR